MVIPEKFRTVTKTSKLFALFLFIALPFIGFYFGTKYQKVQNSFLDCLDENLKESLVTDISKPTYFIDKNVVDSSDSNSFRYDLVRTDFSESRNVIYSLVNWFGFEYEVSDDDQYVAIINYGESAGDETFTLIKNNGELVKEFQDLNSSQRLVPMHWTEHFYWLYQGIPTEDPSGVIRVNADTLEVDYYNFEQSLQESFKQPYTNVNSGWKTYSGSDFDISFQYPPDWEVITGYAQKGAFDFECSYITDYLKNSEECAGTFKSPEVRVRPIDKPLEGLILQGPTSGLGGFCSECAIDNAEVTINGTQYVIPVKIAPPGPEYSMMNNYSTSPDGGINVNETGNNSIWSKIGIELNADDKITYETIIKIVETINPN
ncbi:hypothetical protein K0B04_03220 [Patescibacteria group bacterium]|nr:hypothetical protein [Patescibacteria group bacterium]